MDARGPGALCRVCCNFGDWFRGERAWRHERAELLTGQALYQEVGQLPVCFQHHAHVGAFLVHGAQPLATQVGDHLSAADAVAVIDGHLDPRGFQGSDGAHADGGGQRVV